MADLNALGKGAESTSESSNSKEKSKARKAIEKVVVTTLAALQIGIAGQALASDQNVDSDMVRIPLEFVEDGDNREIPENARTYTSGRIVYAVWDKEDGTLAMKIIKADELGGNDSEVFKFEYKGVVYTFDMLSKVPHATTDVLSRCDGIGGDGIVYLDKKDGRIKGFKEKMCKGKADNLGLMVNIAEREQNIADMDQDIAESEQNIAESEQNIANAMDEMLGNLKSPKEDKKKGKTKDLNDLLVSK